MSSFATVHIRPGHVQPLWAGHPWVYAQAIARVETKKQVSPAPGDEVRVIDPHGNLLGRGFWSPRKAIPVRIVCYDEHLSLDEHVWIAERLRMALKRRQMLSLPCHEQGRETTGYRLMHAEGDGVPGLIADVFGHEDGASPVLVLQVGTAGLRRRNSLILKAIEDVLKPSAVIERSSANIANTEGFAVDEPIQMGVIPDVLRFRERGLAFEIPMDLTQKTGFYFDQRPLRHQLELLAKGRTVLDAYSYVGAIGLSMARGGAKHVTSIDDSLRAIDVGAKLANLNGLSVEFIRNDVRRELTQLQQQGRRFELIVLDPPKIAPTRGDRLHALQYQTKLITQACELLQDGGILAVSSCSTAIGMSELTRALAIGARRAHSIAVVFERVTQGADHPVPAAFPEGQYLSSVIAQVHRDSFGANSLEQEPLSLALSARNPGEFES